MRKMRNRTVCRHMFSALAILLVSAFAVSAAVCSADDFYTPAPGTEPGTIDVSQVIEMNFSTITMEDVLAQYRAAFDGQDVRLVVSGSDIAAVKFLKSCNFRSLSLELGEMLINGDVDGVWSYSDVPGLTSMTYTEGSYSTDLEYMEPYEDLTDFTLNATVQDTSLVGKIPTRLMPALTNLTLNFNNEWLLPDSRGQLYPETLEQINVLIDGEPVTDAAVLPVSMIAGFNACCPDALVNGTPVRDLAGFVVNREDAPFTEEDYRNAVADSVLCGLYDDVTHDRLASSGEVPDDYGKLAFLIMENDITKTSIEALAAGEAFYNIPDSALAETIDDADTIVLVYRDLELAGYYYMGNAYRTYTRLAVVNAADRTVRMQDTVAVNEPPESIESTTVNGIVLGNSGYGEFEDEKAVSLIAEKIGTAALSGEAGAASGTGANFAGNDALYGEILTALDSEQYRSVYEALKGGEVIQSGSKGDTALGVQQILINLGCDIAADGSVGPKTIGALNEVQAAFGMDATDGVDADLCGRLLGMLLITENEEQAGVLLRPVIETESGDPGYYDYLKGCAFERKGRFYKAKEAFEDSGYGDSASRADACEQEWPGNGEIWRSGSLGGSDVTLKFTVNNNISSVGKCFHIYTDDAKLASVLFISGSGTVSTTLPAGTYRIKDGAGREWYGVTDAFGRNGSYEYMSFDDEVEGIDKYRVPLESGYEYTITVDVTEISEDASEVGADSTDWDHWAG